MRSRSALGLLTTCKSISQEAVRFLYRHNVFYLSARTPGMGCIRSCKKPERRTLGAWTKFGLRSKGLASSTNMLMAPKSPIPRPMPQRLLIRT